MYRRLLARLGFVFALGCSAGDAGAVDPFFPGLGNNGIDVSRYAIDLDINPVTGTLKGRANLAIKAERRLTSFSLDLHGLTVTSITVNGSRAKFARKKDKLIITPLHALAPNTSFAVAIAYSGTPKALPDPTDVSKEQHFLGWLKNRNSTYVVSEPVGASTFFPSNDEPTDKSTYKFRITVPTGYRGVANGVPVGMTSSGSRVRYDWEMMQPMATWLATVHVNKLNLYSQRTANGTPVRIFYAAYEPLTHVRGYAAATKMIPYFESLIGPYPFKAFGTVVVQDPALYYALETQAMATFPSGPTVPTEVSVAHELAHQWFGNSVTVAQWKDLWIAEGAATYFEILWSNRNDPAAFDSAMLDNYSYVVNAKLGPAVVESATQMFGDRTYNRGAATLYALRQTVGDATFYRILRSFLTKYRGGNATTQNFIDTAANVSGNAAVRTLLKAWLYNASVPALPPTANSVPVKSGAAARMAKRKSIVRPNLFGNQCGRGSHRGAPKVC